MCHHSPVLHLPHFIQDILPALCTCICVFLVAHIILPSIAHRSDPRMNDRRMSRERSPRHKVKRRQGIHLFSPRPGKAKISLISRSRRLSVLVYACTLFECAIYHNPNTSVLTSFPTPLILYYCIQSESEETDTRCTFQLQQHAAYLLYHLFLVHQSNL